MARYLHFTDNDSNHECRAYNTLPNSISSGKVKIRACIKSIRSGTTPAGGGVSLWRDTAEVEKPYYQAVAYVSLNYDANAGKLNFTGKDDNGNSFGSSYAISNPLADNVVFELEVDLDNKQATGRIVKPDGTEVWSDTITIGSISSLQVYAVNGCGGTVNGDFYADWVKVFVNGELTVSYDFENNDLDGWTIGLCTNSPLDIYEDSAEQCSDPLEYVQPSTPVPVFPGVYVESAGQPQPVQEEPVYPGMVVWTAQPPPSTEEQCGDPPLREWRSPSEGSTIRVIGKVIKKASDIVALMFNAGGSDVEVDISDINAGESKYFDVEVPYPGDAGTLAGTAMTINVGADSCTDVCAQSNEVIAINLPENIEVADISVNVDAIIVMPGKCVTLCNESNTTVTLTGYRVSASNVIVQVTLTVKAKKIDGTIAETYTFKCSDAQAFSVQGG